MKSFPVAHKLPAEQRNLIAQLGKLWFESPERPRPKRDVRKHWEKLIEDWAETDSLPLFVRKARRNRGWIIPHEKGRRSLVPTDNSPAIWALVLACTGEKPSLKKIKNMVDGDCIPIAFALTRAEQTREKRYKCTLNSLRKDHPDYAGWRLAHIEHVGLKRRGDITELDISKLKNHFKSLMSPSNMFFIPKEYSGLAELPEFCQQIKRRHSGY